MVVPAEETFLYIIEMIGAVAAAISGIRLAALKRFDWFGAYIVGLVTALGGGTLRDMMLGNPVFWVSSMKMFLSYFIGTALSMVVVIVFSAILVRRERALLVFDAIGLAMFTVIGIEKALADSKDRHAKRRLPSREFLRRYHEILVRDGVIEFKTDNHDLFRFALDELEPAGWHLDQMTEDLHHDEEMMQGNVMTEYEERFSSMGNPIYKYVISREV